MRNSRKAGNEEVVVMKQRVGVGIIGLGTIGTGVAKVLLGNADVISQRLGFSLDLVRIADLDTETDRGVDLSGVRFDADTKGLLADPDVHIVVELIGGYDLAKRFILEAIDAGKHVVTANKALLALHGREIFDAADKAGVDVLFEAAVGGGIPILRSLREGLAANHIESVLIQQRYFVGWLEAVLHGRQRKPHFIPGLLLLLGLQIEDHPVFE